MEIFEIASPVTRFLSITRPVTRTLLIISPKSSPVNLISLLDTVSQKLKNNNIFTIAKRNVDGQDMLYMSLKLTNGIWVLAELKISPASSDFKVNLPQKYVYNPP